MGIGLKRHVLLKVNVNVCTGPESNTSFIKCRLIYVPGSVCFLLDLLLVHVQQCEEAGEAQRCPVHVE